MSFDMHTQTQSQLESEQCDLFHSLWNVIVAEEQKLTGQFNIARNFACSDWDRNGHVTRIHPNRMDLLNKNMALLTERISRKKYFLLKAFEGVLKKCGYSPEASEIIEYWDQELQKENPNLDDRFAVDGFLPGPIDEKVLGS